MFDIINEKQKCGNILLLAIFCFRSHLTLAFEHVFAHTSDRTVRVWDLRVATAGGVTRLDVKGRPVACFDPQACLVGCLSFSLRPTVSFCENPTIYLFKRRLSVLGHLAQIKHIFVSSDCLSRFFQIFVSIKSTLRHASHIYIYLSACVCG